MELVIPPEPVRVLPPGPYPPHGEERPGTVDLGIRLRDLLYDSAFVTKTARRILANTVSRMVQAPELLHRSYRIIDQLIDTWPLGALIDEARETWTNGPDPRALAVLARAAEVAGTALGWPITLDRRWPMPDEQAIRQLAGPGPQVVVGRGHADGAPAVAVALGVPLVGRQGLALPRVLEVHGDELAGRRDEIVGALKRGDATAVRAVTPVPWDEESQAAMGAVREAAPAQAAFDRYGQAGLLTRELVVFDELLISAPSSRVGARIVRTCSVLMLPRLTPEGRVDAMGVLVWEAPYRPVRVEPPVASLLATLDAPRTPAELAAAAGRPLSEIDPVLEQLAAMGAVRAVA